jgi:TolB protein
MRKSVLTINCIASLLVLLLVSAMPAYATFPGRNGRITFARFVPAANGTAIFSIRPDGSGEQQLTFDASGHSSIFSNWSPDGSRITFDSDRFGNATDFGDVDILTMKADGSDIVQLTSHEGFHGEPVYSPDGQKIAFETDLGALHPLQGIYLINASDGSGLQRVTFAPKGGFDVEPHFSPDGKRIVFTFATGCDPTQGSRRHTGCLSAVEIVNVDGSGRTRITPWGLTTAATDWSPDGTRILFTVRAGTLGNTPSDIYVATTDGKMRVNLTNNPPISVPCPVFSSRGKFSPDGTKIVFTQVTCDGGGLWIMNADGTGKHPLTSNFEDIADWGTNQD